MYKMILIIILISSLYPCAVCYGPQDHPVIQGMNNAIIFLLFVVLFVLSCIASSFFILIKRTKAIKIQRRMNDR